MTQKLQSDPPNWYRWLNTILLAGLCLNYLVRFIPLSVIALTPIADRIALSGVTAAEFGFRLAWAEFALICLAQSIFSTFGFVIILGRETYRWLVGGRRRAILSLRSLGTILGVVVCGIASSANMMSSYFSETGLGIAPIWLKGFCALLLNWASFLVFIEALRDSARYARKLVTLDQAAA